MNILMLHPHDIYSNSEPWTVRITYLAEEFVKRGHNVRMIYHLIDHRTSLEDATARQEYPFTTIPAYRHQLALVAKMRSVAKFARWADVIHFQKCFAHVSIPAIWSGYRLGKPVHYDWDDWEFGIYNYNPMNRVVGSTIDLFEKTLPHLVDSVSVASEPLRQMALDLGVPESRIFEAHVGADLERFRPDIDGSSVRERHHLEGPIVLYLGQLHGAQYLELFLNACAKISEKRPDASFMVVGGGDRFGELFQLAEELKIAHKVVFTGSIDHDDIPLYVAAADVAVATFEDTPQTRCKSPLKIVEYLAAGKAIVASKMGEVPRMIGDAGILVEPGNAEQIADGALRYLDSPELTKEMGKKARLSAETEYNWGVTAENLLTAYELILEEYKWLFWKTKKKTVASRFRNLPSPAHGIKPLPLPPEKKPVKTEQAPVKKELVLAAKKADQKDKPCETCEKELTLPKVEIPEDVLAEKGIDDSDGAIHEIHGPLISTKLKRDLKQGNGPVPYPIKQRPKRKLTWKERLEEFVEGNRDIMGIMDGKKSFIGPYTVQIDPTNRCNNDCIACWCRSPLLLDKSLPPEKVSQTLPLEVVKDLIDDVVAMETKEIYIAGGGEPFCHPNILEIIEYIKKSGLICNINTNFTLVNSEVVRFLADIQVDYMTVSVWAGSAETYADLHPNKTEEAFYDIKENLTELNNIKQMLPFIKVYNVISNLNFQEIKQMIDFALKTKSESVEFTVLDTIPDRTDHLLLSEDQRQWLYKEACRIRDWIVIRENEYRLHLFKYDQFLRRISGEDTTFGEHDKNIIDSMPCYVGWLFARVLADGNVNSCLKSHRIPIGSLYGNSFRELWTGRDQEHFRCKTNVFLKDDPFFSMIGNDPNAECGCYKSCDDLGRIEYMHKRITTMPSWKKGVLKAASLYERATSRYIKPESGE